MTVWVYRDGQLVEKTVALRRDGFYVSRIEPYESPVTGKEINSWGSRDRDMRAVDAYDTRDLPKDHRFKKGR